MTYQKLRNAIDPNKPAVFYFAIQPQHYPLALAGLRKHRLLQPDDTAIIEKPLATSKTGAETLLDTFPLELENASLVLVEHFNLKLVFGDGPIHFRANTPFDAWFNAKQVKEIRIYALEKITVPSERVLFMDNVGSQLRDMITHLLSAMTYPLLMDLPSNGLDTTSIRREKENISRSLRVVDVDKTVWGQYEGYPTPTTSTFTAFTLECDNLRWKGTKIKVVTGKGVPTKYCASEMFFANGLRLLFRHFPNEGIILGVPVKEPSLSGSSLVPVQMEFTYESAFKGMANPPAYLRLLYHILHGDKSSFASPVEALAALRIADELEATKHDFVKYPVGTYPVEAKDWLPSEVNWV